MMRIKEAIQRKKLIHEMNEEYKDFVDSDAGMGLPQPSTCPSPKQTLRRNGSDEDKLQNFVLYLSSKLTEFQKRALKVTWRRLSEAPKTSGRGTLHIMERVLTMLCEKAPGVNAIFYKSAFLACIEDRKHGRVGQGSIATIRDHAHIIINFIDDVLHTMFEGRLENPRYDPESIGAAHCKLGPLGFDRSIWHTFGECFAEVMFMQECIRAYPHAASAWSFFAVAMTDQMFAAGKVHTPSTAPSTPPSEPKCKKPTCVASGSGANGPDLPEKPALARVHSLQSTPKTSRRIQQKSVSVAEVVMQMSSRMKDDVDSADEMVPARDLQHPSGLLSSTKLNNPRKSALPLASSYRLSEGNSFFDDLALSGVRETAIEVPPTAVPATPVVPVPKAHKMSFWEQRSRQNAYIDFDVPISMSNPPASSVHLLTKAQRPFLRSKSEARLPFQSPLKSTVV